MLLNHEQIDVNKAGISVYANCIIENINQLSLIIACENYDLITTQKILNHPNFDVNHIYNNRTVLMYLCKYKKDDSTESNYQDVYIWLINKLLKNTKLNINSHVIEAFTYAIKNNFESAIRLFLNNQKIIECIRPYYINSLLYASSNNYTNLTKRLLIAEIKDISYLRFNHNKHELIKQYIQNPNIINEWNNEYATQLFMLMVLTTDGYYVIKPFRELYKEITRFFNIICRLPIELQMVIANYAYGQRKIFIKTSDFNRIFESEL